MRHNFCISGGSQTGTKALGLAPKWDQGETVGYAETKVLGTDKYQAPKSFHIYLYNQKATQKLPLLFGIDKFPFYFKIKIKSEEILSTVDSPTKTITVFCTQAMKLKIHFL